MTDTQDFLNAIKALKKEHTDLIERLDLEAQMEDIEDALEHDHDSELEDLAAENVQRGVHNSIWNKRELGLK